jgi:hypothetical protein
MLSFWLLYRGVLPQPRTPTPRREISFEDWMYGVHLMPVTRRRDPSEKKNLTDLHFPKWFRNRSLHGLETEAGKKS